MLESRLAGGREYLVDTYGIADIKAWAWVRMAPRVGLELDAYPNVKAWVERIDARPAVQRGLGVPGN